MEKIMVDLESKQRNVEIFKGSNGYFGVKSKKWKF